MDVRKRVTYKDEADDNETYIDKIKKIDSFPKLPNECVNYTDGGGGGTFFNYS